MSNLRSSAIIGGGKKEDRQKNDFYPTPPEVTIALMDFLDLNSDLKVWEPACGNGAMSEVIKTYGHTVHSTDLRLDNGYGIGGMDFLNLPNTLYKGLFDVIITNPPFNLAEEFILKALDKAPIVAMVLKSQYWHAKKRVDLFRENTPAFILPMTWRPDFLGGGSPTMDCIWTVWIKGNEHAQYCQLEKPVNKTQTVLF